MTFDDAGCISVMLWFGIQFTDYAVMSPIFMILAILFGILHFFFEAIYHYEY